MTSSVCCDKEEHLLVQMTDDTARTSIGIGTASQGLELGPLANLEIIAIANKKQQL